MTNIDMAVHPLNPQRNYIPWQRKDIFRLAALESIVKPTPRELARIAYLRKRIYGNLQWFRETRKKV